MIRPPASSPNPDSAESIDSKVVASTSAGRLLRRILTLHPEQLSHIEAAVEQLRTRRRTLRPDHPVHPGETHNQD